VVTRRFLQEEKDRIIESELKGLTLRIYWHILSLNKKETIGIRSIQRALGLSSPSVASHHLEKLRTLGLLEKDATGEYRLVGQVKGGILRYSVWSGSRCIARGLFNGNAYREQSFDTREPKDLQSFPSTPLWSEQPRCRGALVSCDHRVDLPPFSYLLATCEKMGREESARL